MEFERVALSPQPYLYVDREVPYGPEIAQAMGSAFGEVFGFVGQSGITPTSMPMSIYTGMDPEILRFRGGVQVSEADAAKATGSILSDTLPGGEAMTVIHKGAYDNLNVTHQALWKHMEDNGIPAAMPIWEVYLDDPDQVDQAECRTQIFRMIG